MHQNDAKCGKGEGKFKNSQIKQKYIDRHKKQSYYFYKP